MINNTTFDDDEFIVIHDIVNDAILMIGEEHSGKLHNNALEINEFITSIGTSLYTEIIDIIPPNGGLFGVEKHNAISLPEYNIIVDTQVWQFKNEKPCDIDNREYIFERKDYEKLGFKIKKW